MLCPVVFILLFFGVNSARILCIFPTPAMSHQAVFNAYTQELAKHGHDVVVITPNLSSQNDKLSENLTKIEVGLAYKVKEAIKVGPLQRLAKRGVVTDMDVMFESQVVPERIHMMAAILNSPKVKGVIEDKNQHFQLIVVEALMNYNLILSHIFDAPVITFSTLCGLLESEDIIGSLDIRPVFHLNVQKSWLKHLPLYQKIKDFHQDWNMRNMLKQFEKLENELLKQNFGRDAPTVDELKSNVAMIFLSCHSLFGDNRPVPPSVIHLGALHLKPVKKLPQALKEYLDNAKRGVVYISLGTSVNPSNMHKDLLEVFLNAIEALPYDVLWKFDGDNLDKMPKNLKIQKWFPQRDLLMHPNIKAFVMQGGLQSTDEAIDAGVPLVGIPMLGDQWFNTNRYVQLGIGVKLDAITLTAIDLVNAVETVIDNRSYRDTIKKVRYIMNDEPQLPLERAVWWTEHVLRHNGSTHLRTNASNVPCFENHMISVLVVVTLTVFALLMFVLFLFFYIVKFISKSKIRNNENFKIKTW